MHEFLHLFCPNFHPISTIYHLPSLPWRISSYKGTAIMKTKGVFSCFLPLYSPSLHLSGRCASSRGNRLPRRRLRASHSRLYPTNESAMRCILLLQWVPPFLLQLLLALLLCGKRPKIRSYSCHPTLLRLTIPVLSLTIMRIPQKQVSLSSRRPPSSSLPRAQCSSNTASQRGHHHHLDTFATWQSQRI